MDALPLPINAIVHNNHVADLLLELCIALGSLPLHLLVQVRLARRRCWECGSAILTAEPKLKISTWYTTTPQGANQR